MRTCALFEKIAISVPCFRCGTNGKKSDGGIFLNSNFSRQFTAKWYSEHQLGRNGTGLALPHFPVGNEACSVEPYIMLPNP
nr:unnamed protein product [Callosobruchus chinensis]